MFVKIVDELMREDPDLERARFDILEWLTKRFVCQVSQVFRRRDFLCHTRC
jgi:hypothetical protein